MRPTDSAKMIRRDLKAAFPAVKFSVRVRNGNTCDVCWMDGPTAATVEALIGRYEGKGFDGMTDSTYYIKATQSDGQPSAIGYLFCTRKLSDRFVSRLIDAVAAYWGGDIQPITVEDYRRGCFRPIRADLALDWSDAIHRAASDRTTVTHQGV